MLLIGLDVMSVKKAIQKHQIKYQAYSIIFIYCVCVSQLKQWKDYSISHEWVINVYKTVPIWVMLYVYQRYSMVVVKIGLGLGSFKTLQYSINN